MKHYNNNVEYCKQPIEYTKNTQKEILQYALGGMLYMPATRSKIAEDILSKKFSNVNTICLDLEDAIGEDTVEQAEITISRILEKLLTGGITSESLNLPLIFIRVRNPEQVVRLKYMLTKEQFSLLTGFNFPKFDKSNCNGYLEAFKQIVDYVDTPIYFNPIIESKKVLYKQHRLIELQYIQRKLSTFANYILNIRVGATDFCGTFGIRRKIHNTIYDVKVVTDCLIDIVNIFGKNYVVSGAVWEYFKNKNNITDNKWRIGLEQELSLDYINGFVGKTCIHPSQLPVVNESYIVLEEDYNDALSILGMNKLLGVSKSATNNKMNEKKPHTNWAKKIIALSEVYGVRKG